MFLAEQILPLPPSCVFLFATLVFCRACRLRRRRRRNVHANYANLFDRPTPPRAVRHPQTFRQQRLHNNDDRLGRTFQGADMQMIIAPMF